MEVEFGDIDTRKGSAFQAEGVHDFGKPVILSERSELEGISSPMSTKVDQWGLEGQGSRRSFTAKIAKHAKNIAKAIA